MTPATPPSRWLAIVTAIVVLAFTSLRIFVAASLDFRSDEAYYWTWSHQAVLSFLDHPPMVAWFERLGQTIFGDTTLGARIAQIAALSVTEILLADIASKRTGSWNAALVLVLLIESCLNYSWASIVLEPSVPLLLMTTVLLWSLERLDASQNPRWWIHAGLAGGAMLLSKYTALLVVPALLHYLLATRRWLTTLWPWLALAIALVIFTPVLVWNMQHGWASFSFQSARLGGGGPLQVGLLVRYAIYGTLFAGLLLVPLSSIANVRLLIRGDAFMRTVALVVLVPFAYFIWRAATLQINQSWDYFIWPFAGLGLVLALRWDRGWLLGKLVLAGIAIPGLALGGALFYHTLLDRTTWLGRYDPLGQDAGFDLAAKRVVAAANSAGATWIATTDYRTYANLLWHIGKAITVVQVNERARFLDFTGLSSPDPHSTAVYVRLTAEPAPLLAGTDLVDLPPVQISWRGEDVATYYLSTVTGYIPQLSPPPGDEAYAWSPLVP